VRLLLDYRPALRERTGVGEYVHQLARALAAGPDEVFLFTSSWKDRPDPQAMLEVAPARVIDRRIPVRVLNAAWIRFGWPPVERLAGRRVDLVHSPNPVALPTAAASVVTVNDVGFLDHPEWAWAEMRDRYPESVGAHARAADAVVVPSRYAAGLATSRLGVPSDRVFVCPYGLPPGWTDVPRGGPAPAIPAFDARGCILFVGTLTARKNVPGLLDAYERLIAGLPEAPPLVLAGGVRPESAGWLRRLQSPQLVGRVRHIGYVPDAERLALFVGASMLVLPSFDEGFGLTALEAMGLGVPVVVSDRGALPEVVGEAGLLVDPERPDDIAQAMGALLADPGLARRLGEAGRQRARAYTWVRTASLVREAYAAAVVRHTERTRTGRNG